MKLWLSVSIYFDFFVNWKYKALNISGARSLIYCNEEMNLLSNSL